jgi:hypothetical protein
MNRLFTLLMMLSIFSMAEERVENLEGTLTSSLDKKISFSINVLNNWFGTDMKVVVPDLNSSVVASPLIVNLILEDEKLKLLNSNRVTIAVPETKLSLEMDSSCISEYGKNIYNAEAGVRYTLESGLGLETGYKVIRLNSDEVSDLKLNSDSLGLYGRLVMAF